MYVLLHTYYIHTTYILHVSVASFPGSFPENCFSGEEPGNEAKT